MTETDDDRDDRLRLMDGECGHMWEFVTLNFDRENHWWSCFYCDAIKSERKVEHDD